MDYAHTDTELPIEDVYPKLVRDKIPEIVESQGKEAVTRILTDNDEYLGFLRSKLIEEATELAHAESESNQLEELADVMEIMQTILNLKNLTQDEIAVVQNQKNQQRGAFKDRVVMLKKP